LTRRLCVCGRNYPLPDTGLCLVCAEEKRHAEYVDNDHTRDRARRQNWRERKRRQRDKERHRPDEPLSPDADLLELQEEMCALIDWLRARNHSPTAEAMFDQLTELCKQATWGPEEAPEG